MGVAQKLWNYVGLHQPFTDKTKRGRSFTTMSATCSVFRRSVDYIENPLGVKTKGTLSNEFMPLLLQEIGSIRALLTLQLAAPIVCAIVRRLVG
jgi:hypothetical protein